MIEQLQTSSSKILGFKFSGKLHDQDYKMFVPAVDACLAHEHDVCLFVQLEDFHGWDMHAAWDDMQFAVNHYADFKCIALIGDSRWEDWMAKLCKPFTKASVRYFDISEIETAWAWLRKTD
jgi:hypothetical protein